MPHLATDDHLWRAIKAAHERWSPETAERFPPAPQWEPPGPTVGTENCAPDQEVMETVPTVPAVPAQFDEIHQDGRAQQLADQHMAWEERAAILEFSGGLTREEAERVAAEQVGYWPA